MGKIYKSTKEVLIWLGEVLTPLELNTIVWHDDERDYVMVDDYLKDESEGISQTLRSKCAQMADVHGAFSFFRVLADGKHLFEMPFFRVTEGKRLNTGRGWEQALHGLEVLVGLPWWSRVWVLQETVLPSKATVLYGNIVAPWTMIVRATSHWVRHIHFCCHNYFDSRPIKERETAVMLRDLINRVEIVRTMRAKSVRTSLSQLLSMTMHRLATDNRDKVYALLALVTNWSGREPLSADYKLNAGQLWCQVVIEEIQGSQSLQILQGVRNESIPDLPSWVVRTSSEHLRNKQEQRIVHTTIHNASKERLADIEVALDSTLGVLGHSGVDTVLYVSSFMWGTPETSYYKFLAATMAAWQVLAAKHYSPMLLSDSGATDTWQDAFWRTIAANAIDQHYTDTDRVIQTNSDGSLRSTSRKLTLGDHETYEAWWLQTMALGSWAGPDGALLPDRSTWSHVPEEELILYSIAAHASTVQRRFLITQRGLMGTGPPETSPGDTVAIFYGGCVPFLLREQTNLSNATGDIESSLPAPDSDERKALWTLLGDCYVHGVMEGEALDSWDGGNRRYWLQ